MAQTKVYQYCNFSILSGITVTLTTGATYNIHWNIMGLELNNDLHPVTFSIPTTIPTDLRVYYSWYSKTIDKGVTTYDGVGTFSVLIPAGQTSVSYDFISHDTLINNPAVPITDPSYTNLEQFACCELLLDQPALPSECTSQPSGCNVTSTGVVLTVPSVRGAADGSIQFTISGTTGATNNITYKINGVTQTNTGNLTGHTFTGLTSGFYTVIAYQGFCFAQETDVFLEDGQFFTKPFLVSEPADLTAANNPIMLQLKTAVNSPHPQPAKARISIVGGVSNDDRITFNLSYPQQYQAVFTAKGFPDRNTYFLASALKNSVGVTVGSNTPAEIATSLAEALQQDIIIRRLYYITNDGINVNLIARENTPSLNLTSVQFQSTTLSIVLTTQQNGIGEFDGQLTADYSLYAEVYINPDLEFGNTPVESDFIRVGNDLHLPFQRDNIHNFQVETILKNYVSTPNIDFTLTGFTTLPTHDVAYFLKYGEIFPLIANSQTKKKRYKGKTGFKHTVNSALNYEDPNDMSAYLGQELTGYTPTAGTFPRTGVAWLTNSPNTLYVQRDSKQYLSFLLQRNYASSGRTLSLHGDIYFANGTSLTGVTFFNITSGTSTNFGGLTLLAVGYNELGLVNYENSGSTKIRRVDFWVYNNDVNGSYPLTNQKTFLYEIDEAPTRFGTAFLNKLGAWDIFDWVGEVVDDENITSESYQVPREIAANGSSPKGFEANAVYNTQYTKKHTVNSGTIDFVTYTWLQELLQSNKIYSYTEEHQNFLIRDTYTANKSTNVNEYTIQVVFLETLYENNVSI